MLLYDILINHGGVSYQMHFVSEYGLFLAKIITIVLAIIIVSAFLTAIASRGKSSKEKLRIKKVNKKYLEYKNSLQEEILSKSDFKKTIKEQKKQEKLIKKSETPQERRKIFVLTFNGDIKASGSHALAEEITALLTVATEKDEVVLRLESAGGMVPHYGLAASQLQRLREKNIPLTIMIDKIAASGGYMMACVGSKICAAPFAIIGSIGVIAQLPNFYRFLKNKEIDFEQVMAGEYKRTLTIFGENTEKGREKMQEEVDSIHQLFKKFIVMHRPEVNIEQVATGEYWHGLDAKERQLVDDLLTSDEYLLRISEEADIYEVQYLCKKSLAQRLTLGLQSLYQAMFTRQSQTYVM